MPESERPELREKVEACSQTRSREVAPMLRDHLVAESETRLPSVIRCFLDDLDACIVRLRFPLAHHRILRTTNLLEASRVECE